MSLLRYRPISLSKELDNFFNQLVDNNRDGSMVDTSSWVPAVDLKEEDNRYIVLADIPGVNKEDIHVSIDNQTLTIEGERKQEERLEEKGYMRIERQHGSFYRRFSLPETADGEKVDANYKNGVLKISIPKRIASQSRKVQVKD